MWLDALRNDHRHEWCPNYAQEALHLGFQEARRSQSGFAQLRSSLRSLLICACSSKTVSLTNTLVPNFLTLSFVFRSVPFIKWLKALKWEPKIKPWLLFICYSVWELLTKRDLMPQGLQDLKELVEINLSCNKITEIGKKNWIFCRVQL